jgi:hypothetical protein
VQEMKLCCRKQHDKLLQQGGHGAQLDTERQPIFCITGQL